jgi:KAP family P-loop domain
MPPISSHVRRGLLIAGRRADSESSEIRGRHMFYGAMSVGDCEPVRALLDAGVDPNGAFADEDHPITPPIDRPGPEILLTATASAQTDQPTTQDRLGYAPVVAALRALLTGSHTTFPLTIAISAPWGGGKSSVMRLLRDQLRASGERPGWVIVEFPAWRYETGEQLWAAMAKATYDAALDPARLDWYERLMFRIRLELRRSSPWRWVVRAVVIVLGVLIGLLIGTRATSELAPGATAIGLGAVIAIAQGLWVGFGDDFKRAVESLASKPAIAEGDGFGLGAAKQVDALMRELLANDGKVAIFIDDLDRCTPDNVVRVIEAVNQIFVAGADVALEPGKVPPGSTSPTVEDKPRRLVFVMGMDRQVVARGIEVRYDALRKRLAETGDAAGEAYGLSFLDKIVQLWVTLPTPKPKALQDLLGSIAGIDEAWLRERQSARRAEISPVAVVPGKPDGSGDGGGPKVEHEDETPPPEPPPEATDSPAVWEALLVGAEALEQNPRQIKRFNNAFRLQLQLVLRSSTDEFTNDQLKGLARWVAIRLRWGELAHAMDEEPELLAALERSALVGDATRPSAEVPEEQRKWLDPGEFAELPELQAILRSGNDGERVSRLPFERFIRIA